MARSRVALEVKGFKEARQSFRDLVKAMDPATSESSLRGLYRVAQDGIRQSIATAAVYLRDKARSNAGITKSPRRLYTGSKPAIFAFSDFDAARDNKRKRSALVGVRTGLSPSAKDERLYIRWGRGGKRRKDGSTAIGGLSMSLAALFERGTTNGRVSARHYFQSAVSSTKVRIMGIMAQAYRRAVTILNQNTSK